MVVKRSGLPIVEPHLWSYRHLLAVGKGRETDWEGEPTNLSSTDWLGELGTPVKQLFQRNKRLVQEHIG